MVKEDIIDAINYGKKITIEPFSRAKVDVYDEEFSDPSQSVYTSYKAKGTWLVSELQTKSGCTFVPKDDGSCGYWINANDMGSVVPMVSIAGITLLVAARVGWLIYKKAK